MAAARIALGGLLHETHTFLDSRIGIEDFKAQALFFGQDMLTEMTGTQAGLGGMIAEGARLGWEYIPIGYGAAMPSGPATTSAYQTIRQRWMDALRATLPVDGVLLALHGAMVAEGELDVESDILTGVREIVGPDIPVVVELDMHGNLGPRTVELADVLVAYDTNPHIDPVERGKEAAQILARLLEGKTHPAAAFRQPGILLPPQLTGTADLPLAAVHARAAEMEADPSVICICVFGGFAYADTPHTGVSVVVTTDGQPELAARYADELAQIMVDKGMVAPPRAVSAGEAVRQALAMPGGPVILVDSADNVGGGTPADGTDALAAMLAQHVQEGTIVLCDREAVAACYEAGTGATVSMSVGATRVDRFHGSPVPVTGVVRALTDGRFTCESPNNHFASLYGSVIDMGRTVWLRADGVNILLTERRTPPLDLAQLRSAGIIPEQQKMIVVKSAVAYRAAYLPIAAGVIEMDTPGLCSADLSRFPYQHLTRPIYPLDSKVQ